MRLPASILEHRVTLEAIGQSGPRGTTPGATRPNIAAHCEESSKLRIDERATGDTAGTEIVASTLVITQLENYMPPGSFITTELNGRQQVFNAKRWKFSSAPEHAEMWLV